MRKLRTTRILWISRHRLTPSTQSGTPFRMVEELRSQYPNLTLLDGLSPRVVWREQRKLNSRLAWACTTLIPSFWADGLRGQRFDWDRSPSMSRYYAHQIQTAIRIHNPELVIGDKAYVELAHIDTTVPIIYLHDAMAEDLMNYDAYFRRFGLLSRRHALLLQNAALIRSKMRVFSSEWARDACILRHPNMKRDTITVYNGPNLPEHILLQTPPIRSLEPPIQFLLIGVDWYRKGCDAAIQIVSTLRKRTGVDIRLSICGTEPPKGRVPPSFVSCHPRKLDKAVPADLEALTQHFRNAHFFILPSTKECLSGACIEAMAFGLPCIVRDSGGQRELLGEGLSGYLIQDESGSGIVERLSSALMDPTVYQALSGAAFDRYRNHFSWEVWRGQMDHLIHITISRARPNGDVDAG